jgi:hypothetical protein
LTIIAVVFLMHICLTLCTFLLNSRTFFLLNACFSSLHHFVLNPCTFLFLQRSRRLVLHSLVYLRGQFSFYQWSIRCNQSFSLHWTSNFNFIIASWMLFDALYRFRATYSKCGNNNLTSDDYLKTFVLLSTLVISWFFNMMLIVYVIGIWLIVQSIIVDKTKLISLTRTNKDDLWFPDNSNRLYLELRCVLPVNFTSILTFILFLHKRWNCWL